MNHTRRIARGIEAGLKVGKGGELWLMGESKNRAQL